MEAGGETGSTPPHTLAGELTGILVEALPQFLAEVLTLALEFRIEPGRVTAVLPNLAWQEVFRDHAADLVRTHLRPLDMRLDIISGQDAGEAGDPAVRRFDDFLGDPGNQLALAACRRVVEAPGIEHNPLYLHGPPGSGKSHLLAAIASEYRDMLGEASVVELSGPVFVTQAAQELAERRSTPLRERLNRAAVVLLDGIEALAGRALAQEEMFHLINSCLERGAQLVFTGPTAPRKLSDIEDRLVTRLGWGLAVELEAPQIETRLALLRKLSGSTAQTREPVELTRLVETLAPDMHQVVRLAERLSQGEAVQTGSDVASFDRILQVVAERYGLRPGDLAGKRRLRQVTWARQMALFLGRRLTGHSLEALGGMVGGRDHSTVLYSIRQAEARSKDPAFSKEVGSLTQQILSQDPDS